MQGEAWHFWSLLGTIIGSVVGGVFFLGRLYQRVNHHDELFEKCDSAALGTTAENVKAAFEESILYDVTFEQADTYIDNNVTNLAEAKAYLKKLSKVVLAILKFNGLVK